MKKLYLLFFVSIIGCAEKLDPITVCEEDLLCTEEFRTLVYEYTVDGTPTDLYDYYVKNLDNGTVYDFQDDLFGDAVGLFIIATDAQLEEVEKEGTIFRFFGFENQDADPIEIDFTVGHDCCHVIAIEGPFRD